MSEPLPDWFERHITLVDDRRFVRVFSGKYKNDPCGTGFADSRYALAKGPWRTLYAAENLKTAFAEVIIGDAFAKHGNHFQVLFDDLEEKVVSNLLPAAKPLRMLDLTGNNCTKLHISTDTAKGETHEHGQDLAQRIYDHHQDMIDGLLWRSRHTENDAYAVFDWAFERIQCNEVEPTPLLSHPATGRIIEEYDLKVVRLDDL